ncbi:formylglycine-generating enzyme family protein [Lutibacter sp. TH_r2]|uniref:formylglycine-generating enzyme family protein n=1 Tax=Lutibacter sp. TH_r2 TaxID=3082083 RepID=UPI0029557A2C|nr:formylglycine-generating enzyme family protein [Lutibacter sp. TH_r2]MDV7188376.1 formylglycine-generating enzyme family protein [Lutibacter sp. TH_r2]
MKTIYLVLVVAFLFISCKEVKKEKQLENKEAIKEVQIEKNKDSLEMVYFEGGTIKIGSQNLPNEQPAFEMEIQPFYLDKNLVTVAEFRIFVNETSYTTEAEKFGDSGVFSFEKGNWELLKGANWEFPLGKDKPKAIDNHPVTHVSWNDAKAYAAWKGKRLPTEFEWEFAAKNGKNSNNKYAWGNSIVVEGKYQANVWQGNSIQEQEVLDGFLLTSPVGVYPASEMGLFDMGGNVWQWCDNYFKPYPYNKSQAPQSPNVRSTRGGSFMFDQALENSYTTTFRSQNSIDTSLFNMGFRCAK